MKIAFKLQCLFALLAGFLLVFAFSPMHFFWFAIICPAILYALLIPHHAGRAALIGFLFGLGFFGFGASWVFVAIYVFGGSSAFVAAIITLLFVVVLAGFFALLGLLLQRYFPKNNFAKSLLVYPALWALLEALRSWIFTGFPWLILGHTVVDSLFAGLAPIFGAFACSFWLVFLGSLFLAAAMPHFDRKQNYSWRASNFSLLALIIVSAAAYGSNYIHWTNVADKPLSVSLVQGDIAQSLRWDNNQVNNILNTYQALTEGHFQSDLIIWPEAAVPLDSEQAQPFIQQIKKELEPTHSALITGIPYKSGKNYYNSVITVGDAEGVYSKRHLVPFGEYVPLQKYLRGVIAFFDLPMSDFLPGDFNQELVTAHDIPIGVYICYEVAYGNVVRADLPMAGLLVTVSDDAWFGKTFAPWQHLQIGQFAALATGRQMLFVGNNGVTAIIDQKGHVQSALPQFTANVLTGEVFEYFGATPWVILGDAPWLIMMLIFLAACYSKRRGGSYD